MADWKAWQPVYAEFNLRDHGDATEQRGAREHGLDLRFPNYEEWWRNHVVPSTNRPKNIFYRRGVDKAIHGMSQLSHSLFADLVDAADSLTYVRGGDLGGPGFRNCLNAIKSCGDALQKFTELQNAIEGPLATMVGRTIKLSTKKQWKKVWRPHREKLIGYRNYLTHQGQPQIMLVPAPDGSETPHVLKKKYVVRAKYMSWEQQRADYRRNPARWAALPEVCQELYNETIEWLNAAYGRLVWILRALPGDPAYQQLWGWDATQGPKAAPAAMLTNLHPLQGSGLTIVQNLRSNQGNG